MSFLRRRRAKTLRESLLIAERNLDQVIDVLIASPSRCHTVIGALEETSALLQAVEVESQPEGLPEEADALWKPLRARMVRVHSLLESALHFQCGTLLTHPVVEITYTAEGDLTRADADFHLAMQA